MTEIRSTSASRYGLKMDSGWQDKPVKNPVIVVIHGFNSTRAGVEFLAAPLRKAGFACGMIAYPNDQALADSAELVSSELKKFAKDNPEQQIALVTHSMGGLVARACIENRELDPGSVIQLIMVAPPNHGSELAHVGFATDTVELLTEMDWQKPLEGLLNRVDDGMGEAVEDLTPGSAFLMQLATYKRNAKVRYTIILGTKAPLTAEQVNQTRQALADYRDRLRFLKLFDSQLELLLRDPDELINGLGDGVVAVKRGRLDGVKDTVLLKFHHIDTDPSSTGVKQINQVVLDRLTSA